MFLCLSSCSCAHYLCSVPLFCVLSLSEPNLSFKHVKPLSLQLQAPIFDKQLFLSINTCSDTFLNPCTHSQAPTCIFKLPHTFLNIIMHSQPTPTVSESPPISESATESKCSTPWLGRRYRIASNYCDPPVTLAANASSWHQLRNLSVLCSSSSSPFSSLQNHSKHWKNHRSHTANLCLIINLHLCLSSLILHSNHLISLALPWDPPF